jgi:hypothetical protein
MLRRRPLGAVSLSLPSVGSGAGERRRFAAGGRSFRRFSRLGRRPRRVDTQIGGDAAELAHQFAARLVVVDLDGLRGQLVAVQPVEHLHERGDRRDVAVGDRFEESSDYRAGGPWAGNGGFQTPPPGARLKRALRLMQRLYGFAFERWL